MLRGLATSTKDVKLALQKSWRRDTSRGRLRLRSIQKLGARTDLVRCQSFSSNSARRLAVIWSPAWSAATDSRRARLIRASMSPRSRDRSARSCWTSGLSGGASGAGSGPNSFRRASSAVSCGVSSCAISSVASWMRTVSARKIAQRRIVLGHHFDAGLHPVQIGVGGIESVIGTGLGESGSQGDPEETED